VTVETHHVFGMNNPFAFSATTTHSLRFLRPLMVLAMAALLVCLTVYFGFVRPTQERLVESQQTLDALQQQHRSGQTAKTTQQALSRFWQNLPTQQEFTHLGVRLSTLAKQNKVTIPGMDYRMESSKKEAIPKGSITFQAFGSYEAIRRFIYQLEKTGPYLIIEKLTAERTKQADRVAFTLQIGTFFRPRSVHGVAKETIS